MSNTEPLPEKSAQWLSWAYQEHALSEVPVNRTYMARQRYAANSSCMRALRDRGLLGDDLELTDEGRAVAKAQGPVVRCDACKRFDWAHVHGIRVKERDSELEPFYGRLCQRCVRLP